MAWLVKTLELREIEYQPALFSFFAAFAVMALLILIRALRDALYLSHFPVAFLPFMMFMTALLSLLAVGLFTHMLSRFSPRQTSILWFALMMLGIIVVWPMAIGGQPLAVIGFYFITVTAMPILVSGTWLIISEHFNLRQAKRLYGFISAGGTLGALSSGALLNWLVNNMQVGTVLFVLPVVGILLMISQSQIKPAQKSIRLMKTVDMSSDDEKNVSVKESITLISKTRYLRLITFIIMIATLSSTLVDYQFKAFVQNGFSDTSSLTAFFAKFYAIAGGISLIIQLFFTGRIIKQKGMIAGLSFLPLLLLIGSVGFLAMPSLVLVTVLRGSDNSLRKSLHHCLVECLYLGIPVKTMRKTKAFIDATADSVAEALGALLIFAWVGLAGYSAVSLSICIITLSALFLWANKHDGCQIIKEHFSASSASNQVVANCYHLNQSQDPTSFPIEACK